MPRKISGKISRRNFIKTSALGVVAGGTMLSSMSLDAFAGRTAKKGLARKSGDDLVVKLSDNAPLSKVGGNVKVNDEIMLIRKSETEFKAVKTICTHKGCDVELEGNKFVCPCHGSEYTIDGKVTEGPAKADLKTFETIFDSEKGTITIQMSAGTEKKDDTKDK
jgi:Rieske Fe-S protein